MQQAELDLKRAQEEFERQIEITKLLLEGLSSAQVSFQFQNQLLEIYHLLAFSSIGKSCTLFERLCHVTNRVLQSMLSSYVESPT